MVSLVNRHEGLVGVIFLVCLARVVFAGGVDRPRDVFATGASLMTMKTSWISRWSYGGQNCSAASMAKAFAWLVSSATTVAVWLLLYPTWCCFTERSPSCVTLIAPAMLGNDRQQSKQSGNKFRV